MKLLQMYRHKNEAYGLRVSLEWHKLNATYGTCPAQNVHELSVIYTYQTFQKDLPLYYTLQERTK